MAEYDFDLNTQETLDRLGFSQTKLTRLVNEGRLSRVPKNPGSHKGKGAGWLYSSLQIDEFIEAKNTKKSLSEKDSKKECVDHSCGNENCETKIVSQASIRTSAQTPTQFTSKKPWWKKIFS